MTRCMEAQLPSAIPSVGERRRSVRSLGQPPGSHTIKPTLTPENLSRRCDQHAERLKTVPFKEFEKMIADLKKENFDLKLRLFHLEDVQREHPSGTAARSSKQQRTVGTQTPLDRMAISSPQTYYTAFEALAEGIALAPVSASPGSWRGVGRVRGAGRGDDGQVTIIEHEQQDRNVDEMTEAFSNVHITPPAEDGMSMDKVQGWLQELEEEDGLIDNDDPADDDDQISPLRITNTTWWRKD